MGRAPSFTTIGPAEIMAPLPPIAWHVQGLRLAPGAAIAFCGYGFSGKSLIAQSVALSVAAGRHLFGLFYARQGRALYVDYDGQGARLSRERFQRLARGQGISAQDLGDRLHLATLPNVFLDGSGEAIEAAFDGYQLVVVDALRGAAPSLDENSSEIRKAIDRLNRASEKSNATVILVHHARKPAQGTDDALSPFSMRGSSAIFDACASVFMFGVKKDEPIRVRQTKCRLTGTPLPEFGIRIEDVAEGDERRAGLRLVHLDAEQLEQVQSAEGASARVSRRILEALGGYADGFAGTKNELLAKLGGNRQAFLDALRQLEEGGQVTLSAKPPVIRRAGAPTGSR